MKIGELLQKIDYKEFIGDADAEFTGLCTDSQEVKEGDLFFCYKGKEYDSHDFAENAVSRGAIAVVCERKLNCKTAQIIVSDGLPA